MAYAQRKGKYYLPLEDDVITKPDYIQAIKRSLVAGDDFLLADFASLGFIGKLFHSKELPTFVQFIILFYDAKPVDWLLSNYIFVKVCLQELTETEYCPKAMKKAIKKFRPALFQHIGRESSFDGKVQLWQEGDFGNVSSCVPHKDNPPARRIWSTLTIYQPHTLENAYRGKTFFWALTPRASDTLTIEFLARINVSSFVFKSGDADHPADQLRDAVVEVTIDNSLTNWKEVGRFHHGTSQGSLRSNELISAIRIRITKESPNWVILREIWIKAVS
ncbi:alpha-1,3-mannosyl-glycoprotein 4-beta-N-acetylglucosaminyltransferase A-like [Paramacrobiotus metropolitanus]|uniref:alpha-1,3-mannosyl-glycoprotein 4-beta-N-acetylglucosaminyltransferase A-like n=1 Tax=Paramacrobiotus metropolitanus TaxID=2943436 RepID=UPI0024458F6A|nr:alpha-1,3-mannosyl-glycoprotein 4-beta-N-acetylglucosaminyltransferase A-like [Paramacrobiotus metropolitanus]